MSEPNNPLTPELCRTFVAMERHQGSVTATARELRLNEASVSKRIRPLVRGAPPFLPQPWLLKRGKKFFLTDEGKAMLPVAKEQAERWQHFTAFASAGRMPGITVACGQEAAGGAVLEAAQAFRRVHPQARLRIAVVRGRRRIEGVANGLYDLALVTHSPVAVREIARREVRVDVVRDEELGMACGKRSLWSAEFTRTERPVKFDELKAWPLVLPEADSPIRRQWDERLRRQESATMPQVAIEVGGWRVLAGYVAAGFGVGLLPRALAADTNGQLHWRPLAEPLRPANRLYAVRLPQPANELVEVFGKVLGARIG